MPSQSFSGPGWHAFDIPKKVDRITVDIRGAASGGNNSHGGRVVGVLIINDTWNTLQCFVGGQGGAHSGSNGGVGGKGGGAAGGNGHQGLAGGDGGGGASYLRINTTSGTIKAAAGGGGGNSGDAGTGGNGGADVGESGHAGTAGPNVTSSATGGTQTQGGNGGTSGAGTQYNGTNAADDTLGQAGTGGVAGSGVVCHGGGGGGGGFHAGGGGHASAPGYAPGGGGAGGASYNNGLTQVSIYTQGGGGDGDGSITLSWISPTAENQPPNPPTDVKLNKQAVTDGMFTRIVGAPTVSAEVNDPDKDDTRLVMYWSTNSNFSNSHGPRQSPLVKNHTRAEVDLPDLAQNTRYYVRLYAEDQHGRRSVTYNAFNFWTNTAATPDDLRINGGNTGITINTIDSATFSWNFNDPNQGDLQSGFELEYRTSATSTSGPGNWQLISQPNKADNMTPVAGPPARSRNQWVSNPSTFKGNTYYEWQVRTKDQQGLWSDWSTLVNFFTSSTTTPPDPLSPNGPVNASPAEDVTDGVTFTWKFRDPDKNDSQQRADIRYRVVGDDDTSWVTVLGSVTEPGSGSTWHIPAGNFQVGYHYEWQVRTYDSTSHQSDWSDSAYFWSIGTPGSGGGQPPLPDIPVPQDVLGCGAYRVFIYEQGGERVLGELTPVATLSFGRLRDDISTANIATNGLGDPDCCEFYGQLRCWMHEVVIYRNEVRVWEGPITRLTFNRDDVEIEARDVMIYLYRRIMRQGFNDAYRIVSRSSNGTITEDAGIMPVTERAQIIIANALAPYDPNILPYLTVITGPKDAKEGRSIPDWNLTAFEQIDQFAATGGMDYTVIGRRIILWDTHNPIGRLPMMTDGDFSDPPIVSEYGMQLATLMAVTNGNGLYATAEVDNKSRPAGTPPYYPYGPIEMLASAYGETATAEPTAMTPEQVKKEQESLAGQAASNLADRFPSPLVVRVPDNSTLAADCNLGFQQLVPGVWIPLTSSGACRSVTQWQKLDSVSVNSDSGGEQITVVLSPAPQGGQDPDDTGASEDEG